MKKTLVVFVAVFCSVRAAEFLYPLFSINPDYLFCIYQKSPHHIELWQWHVQKGTAQQVLMSRYNPAGVRLLPDGSGYSFIDNGTINIKEFCKRSPRTLSLDAPVARLELLSWITPTHFYASAQYRDRYGIFEVTRDGEVFPLIIERGADCQYPSVINSSCGSSLFYIERRNDSYRILCVPYRARGYDKNEFRERVIDYYDHENDLEKRCCVSFGLNPIIFLTMIDNCHGFVVEHQKVISKRDRIISFSYHQIYAHKFDQDYYEVRKLFTFVIPAELLMWGSPNRVYESLLPFLPYHTGDFIVYVDSDYEGNLRVKRYDCVRDRIDDISSSSSVSSSIDQLGSVERSFCFSPCRLFDGRLIWGGMIQGGCFLPGMELGDMGITFSFSSVDGWV